MASEIIINKFFDGMLSVTGMMKHDCESDDEFKKRLKKKHGIVEEIFPHWRVSSPKYNKIELVDDDNDLRIMSIKVVDGKVRFREECDRHFEKNISTEEAKEILFEAISFIESWEGKYQSALKKEIDN